MASKHFSSTLNDTLKSSIITEISALEIVLSNGWKMGGFITCWITDADLVIWGNKNTGTVSPLSRGKSMFCQFNVFVVSALSLGSIKTFTKKWWSQLQAWNMTDCTAQWDAKAGISMGKKRLGGELKRCLFVFFFHRFRGVSSHWKLLLKIPDFPDLLH